MNEQRKDLFPVTNHASVQKATPERHRNQNVVTLSLWQLDISLFSGFLLFIKIKTIVKLLNDSCVWFMCLDTTLLLVGRAILKALARGCNFIKGSKSTNRILTITNTSHESIPPLCKLINIDHWPITSKIRAWDLPGNWDRSLLKFVKPFKSVL